VTAAAYKFTATNDSFKIKKLHFTMTDASGISGVDVMDGGTPVLSNQPASISMTFNIPTNSQPNVAAGATKVLTVVLHLSNIGTPGGGASAADHTITLASGTALQGSSGVEGAITAGANTAGKTLVAYASIPTITLVSLPSTTLGAGTKTLAKFNIAAAGGDIAWKAIAFNVASSSGVLSITNAKVYDSSHTLVAGDFKNTSSASLSGALADNGVSIFVADDEQQISGSETYTLEATIQVGTLANGDNISTTILNPASGPTADTYGNVAGTLADSSFIWSDESVTSPAHSTATADWHNDYLVKDLPAASQTLSF
jgi:hypothetical protein